MGLHPGTWSLRRDLILLPDSCDPLYNRGKSEAKRGQVITAHQDAIAAAQLAAVAIADMKGFDLLLLDVSDLVVVTELFVIATGTSSRHVKTLVEEAEHQVKTETGRRPLRSEGEDHGRWVLLDYGDFVVHVFDQTTRDYYELERLWADAPSIAVESVAAEA